MGGMDLDGIVAGFSRPGGSATEGRRNGRHLLDVHRPPEGPRLGLRCRGAQRASPLDFVGEEPGVGYLQSYLIALRRARPAADRRASGREETVFVSPQLLETAATASIDESVASDDQAHVVRADPAQQAGQ